MSFIFDNVVHVRSSLTKLDDVIIPTSALDGPSCYVLTNGIVLKETRGIFFRVLLSTGERAWTIKDVPYLLNVLAGYPKQISWLIQRRSLPLAIFLLYSLEFLTNSFPSRAGAHFRIISSMRLPKTPLPKCFIMVSAPKRSPSSHRRFRMVYIQHASSLDFVSSMSIPYRDKTAFNER